MIKKPKKEENIIAKHEATEEDMAFEPKNIVSYPPYKPPEAPKNTSSSPPVPSSTPPPFKLSFEQVQFPIFKYSREQLNPEQQKNPPYGECFTTQFSPTGSHIACGYSNGFVQIFSLNDKKAPISFKVGTYPVTSIKWNKKKDTTLLVGSADGYVTHWHTSTGKVLHSMHEIDNAINSVDYTRDYKRFATAGNDVVVRVYDESMKSIITSMHPFKFDEPGHSGRIFCVKFHPENDNMLVTGGWDKTVQFYDVRGSKICHSIYGPEICGDSLDISGNFLLTGGWSTSTQLKIWDIRNLKCVSEVIYETGEKNFPTYIYSVKFNQRKDQKVFAVGGVNNNLFRIFDLDTFNVYHGKNAPFNIWINNNQEEGKEDEDKNNNINNENKEEEQEDYVDDNNRPWPLFGNKEPKFGVYSMDFVRVRDRRELFACGCSDGGIRIYSLSN